MAPTPTTPPRIGVTRSASSSPSSPSSTTSRRSAWWTLLGATVVAVIIPHVPIVSLVVRPLVWLSTFAHEGGHGIGAMLVGGTFTSLQIFPDASGVAHHTIAHSTPTTDAVTAMAGLIGPAVAAMVLLWLGVSDRLARVGLVITGLLALAMLTVTTGFATIIAVGTAVVCVTVAVAWPRIARLFVLVVAVELAGAVFSRADYLFMAEAETGAGVMPSDVAHVATALGGHYLLWGVAIGALSLMLLGLGLAGFFVGDTLLLRLSAAWHRLRQRRSKA